MAIASALRSTAEDVSFMMAKPGIHSVLFDSFADVPDAWHAVCRPDDLAMDSRALSVFQRTLKEQCRCWGVIVFDGAGTAIGCAALCAFKAGFMSVLFCGLPVPSGATHLRVRDGACAETVVIEVERAMRGLAASLKSRLLVFKEFGHASKPLAAAPLSPSSPFVAS